MLPSLFVHLTAFLAHSAHPLPQWLQEPDWLRPLSRVIRTFLLQHKAVGLYLIIFAEELGVPLPIPGDVAIMTGGYLVRIHQMGYVGAVAAVVVGSMTGSFVLFTISRRFGHSFLTRHGRFIGLDARRLAKAEANFRRWGPWAIIIGRLIPGMRVILSAFAGAFNVPYRVFVPSVFVSSLVWAFVFIWLGRTFGVRTLQLFRIFPAHLLPIAAGLVGAAIVGWHIYERRHSRAITPVANTNLP